MAELSHRNHADMNILRGMVLMVPKEAQVKFAANVCGQRLMLGPWWLRVMHWTICRVRGWNPTVTWFLFFERLQRGFPEQVIDDFARHIAFGKDASDARSVGGLNQAEVTTTLSLLRHFLKGVDLPTVYANVLWPPAPSTTEAGQ